MPPNVRTRATASPARARSPSPSATRPASTKKASAKAKSSESISAAAWLLLITTYFAYVCIYCARKPFAVAKSSIKSELSMSDQDLGNIDTALLFTYAVGQLSLGVAVKAIGRKWTLMLAFLLSGASTAAFGLFDSPMMMILLWGLAGLTAAPASPLFSTLVGESVPDAVRSTVIGIWSSCENLGGVVANKVATVGLVNHGWRAAFFLSGPVVAIWSAALLLVLPKDTPTPPAAKARPAKAATTAKKPKAGAAAAPAPLSVPGVAPAAFAYVLTKCCRYCLMFWLPFILSDYLQMSKERAGDISTVLDLGGTIGAVLTGVACDMLYGGCALHTAMHLCALTGLSFLGWAAACLAGSATGVHVLSIAAIGFFIAGPGGVLGASARGLVGYAGHGDDKELVASVAGLVNGLASLGARSEASKEENPCTRRAPS